MISTDDTYFVKAGYPAFLTPAGGFEPPVRNSAHFLSGEEP